MELQKELNTKNVRNAGLVLSKLRESEKVSQVDLAKKMKKAQSFVSKVENKSKSPNLRTIVNYLDKLGYKIFFVKK